MTSAADANGIDERVEEAGGVEDVRELAGCGRVHFGLRSAIEGDVSLVVYTLHQPTRKGMNKGHEDLPEHNTSAL